MKPGSNSFTWSWFPFQARQLFHCISALLEIFSYWAKTVSDVKDNVLRGKKCSSLTGLPHLTPMGQGFSLCFILRLEFSFLPSLISEESLSAGHMGGQTREAEWFSEGPTPSFRDTTVSRGLRITGVKSV